MIGFAQLKKAAAKTFNRARRNRAGVVALIAGGALLAVLNGVSQGNGAWLPFVPPASPPARYLQASAYDLNTKDVVIFGGQTAAGLSNETWTWNGDNWRQKQPIVKPAARSGASMAFDAAPRRDGDVRRANRRRTQQRDLDVEWRELEQAEPS